MHVWCIIHYAILKTSLQLIFTILKVIFCLKEFCKKKKMIASLQITIPILKRVLSLIESPGFLIETDNKWSKI